MQLWAVSSAPAVGELAKGSVAKVCVPQRLSTAFKLLSSQAKRHDVLCQLRRRDCGNRSK